MSVSLSPRSRTVTGIAIVVVLAALAVGTFVVFNAGGDDGNNTIAGPPVTALPDGSLPPELMNTGEDWDTIVRSTLAYRHWLYLHPDPELLINIEVPSYDGFEDSKLGLTNLATKGWRYDPPREPLIAELVRLREREADNVVILFIRFGPTPAVRVVDPAGKVIQNSPGIPPGAALWTMVREPATDAHWRLWRVTPFTTEPGPA